MTWTESLLDDSNGPRPSVHTPKLNLYVKSFLTKSTVLHHVTYFSLSYMSLGRLNVTDKVLHDKLDFVPCLFNHLVEFLFHKGFIF